MAERLHVLPYSGGLLEQPARTLLRMEAVLIAHTAAETANANRERAESRLDERMKSGDF